MSVTIFGKYFSPLAIWLEILYYVCMTVTVVLVCRNLYLAVRVSRRSEEGQQPGLSRSGSIRRRLFCAAKVSALSGLILFVAYFLQ